MRILLILFGVLCSVFRVDAQLKIVDGVVAVVGKNIVLKSDIDNQFYQMKEQGLVEDDADKCAIFEELLFEKLLLHQADLDSIEVGEEEVQLTVQRRLDLIQQQIGSKAKMEQYYKKTIIEIEEELAPLVKNQLTAQRMLREVTADVEITPSEVRAFYKALPQDSLPLIDAEVEYAKITRFPKPTPEAVAAAIQQLNDLRQRVEDGSSFSTMAVLYSEDPGSAKAGGKYEGIQRGQFVKEFEAVAFNLKQGEISEPFKSEYGYHIVQLLKRRGEELDLRHILIKPKISQEDLANTKDFMDSIRNLIVEKELTFDQAAERFSSDENSKLNGGISVNPQTGDPRWEIGQLDQTVFNVLNGLTVGRVSPPSFFRTPDGKEGYRLLKLNDKSQPHRADLRSDYQRIQQAALQEKNQEATQDWIREKLSTTYVRVNNDYINCTFKNDWIKKSQYVE